MHVINEVETGVHFEKKKFPSILLTGELRTTIEVIDQISQLFNTLENG